MSHSSTKKKRSRDVENLQLPLFLPTSTIIIRFPDLSSFVHQENHLFILRLNGRYRQDTAEQLCYLLHSQNLFCGLSTRSGNDKEILILAKNNAETCMAESTIIQQTLQKMNITVHVRNETFSGLPMNLTGIMLTTHFLLKIRLAGCVPVGTSNQMCFALNNQFEAKELECIRIHKMSIDMHSDMIGLTVLFSPVVYALQTMNHQTRDNTNSQVLRKASQSSIREQDVLFALPKMGKCHKVSDILRTEEDLMNRMTSARGNTSVKNRTAKYPQTELEFREYWYETHGIELPRDLGGYMVVNFNAGRPGSDFVYPMCCISTQWHMIARSTRNKATVILNRFINIAKTLFGSVHVHESKPSRSNENDPPVADGPHNQWFLSGAKILEEEEDKLTQPALKKILK